MKPWIKKLTAILFSASVAASALAMPASAAWQQSGSQWRYTTGSGYATGWRQIGGTWYYFNGSGAMVTGLQSIAGKQYYFFERSQGGHLRGEMLLTDGSGAIQP